MDTIRHVSRWIYNDFTRVIPTLTETSYRIVLRVDRDMLHNSALTFADVSKRNNANANYQFKSLLLLLELFRQCDKGVKDNPDLAKHYPFMKVYLEWVPSANNPDRACEYRLHAFFTAASSGEEFVNCGTVLQNMLYQNDMLAEESATSTSGRRKIDPLKNLKHHQEWKRIRTEVYLRIICGIARGDQVIGNNLDRYLSHGHSLGDMNNNAHPWHVFNIRHCIRHTKQKYGNVDKKYYSMKSYVLNGAHDFPDYDKIIRLTPDQFAPHNFIRKMLPDIQEWNDRMHPPKSIIRAIPARVEDEEEYKEATDTAMIPLLNGDKPASPETRFNDAQLGEFDIRTSEELEEARLEAFTTRGDFHVMADESTQHFIDHVDPHKNTPQWRNAYRKFQNWCIEQTKSRCFTADSNVSPMIRRIAAWGETRPRVQSTYTPIDDTLSPFANRIIRTLEQMEQYDLISTTHLLYYVILHARYDAYRRALDKIKLNAFFFGEGASGKSFLFKLLAADSIPGSVVELTYQTGKADAIDGNRNGEITVMHETPPTMFRSKAMGRSADKSEESRWKDKLTRQKVTVKTFYMDEDTGKRKNRTAESECGGVWFGACNQTADDIEEALATRFLKITCETTVRTDKDISDCQNAERRMDKITSEERRAIRMQRREEQYRMCIIEHFIWMGCIKDVDETAYHIVIGQFKNELRKLRQDLNPRDFERVRILCRVQAICTALDTVYNLPNGELHGQMFEPEHLPIIEPYMVITEEMVIFTLSILSFMFVSNTEHKVFHTLYTMFHSGTKPKNYLVREDGPDANYVLCGKINSVVGEIHKKLPLNRGRVPEDEIKALFHNLPRRHILSRGYEQTHDSPATKEKATGPQRSAQAAVYTREGIYVHQKYLEKFRRRHVDPVREILEKLSHKYSREKKMILARPVINSYHILKIFRRVPNDKALVERNILHNTEASRAVLGLETVAPCRRTKSYSYTADLDDIAYRTRCDQLNISSITPEEIHRRVHDHNGRTFVYPDAFCGGPPQSPVESKIETVADRLTASASATVQKKSFTQMQMSTAGLGTKKYHEALKRKREEELATSSKRPRNEMTQPSSNIISTS